MNDGPARRFHDATVAVAKTLDTPDATPELLLRLGLPGLMHRLGLQARVPEHESLIRMHQLSQTLLLETAHRVSESLTNASVPHFFAKGVAMIDVVYRPGDRAMADIDVYVPLEHRSAALTVLVKLGFNTLPDSEQAGPAELRSALALEGTGGSVMERAPLDLHWSLDPVERLLPRRDRAIPQRFWSGLTHSSGLPVPRPEHHAAILAHHLVHTDLLHVRSLLDLAFVFDAWPESAGLEFLASCRELRIERFALILARIVADDFGIGRTNALHGTHEPGGFANRLDLERWLLLVCRTHPEDDSMITVKRIRRRMHLIDSGRGGGGAATLLGDVFFPPAAFLRWRWQTESVSRARIKHYGQLARKTIPFLQ